MLSGICPERNRMKRIAWMLIALAGFAAAAQAEELNKFSIAPRDATSVKVVLAQQAKPALEIVLTAGKAGEMANFTQANLGSTIAFEIAGETVSTPLVNAPISGGELTIELDDADTALRLAKKLMVE